MQDGLAIYDKIVQTRAKGIDVNITVFGYCMSMGVPILQAATTRRAGPNATFLMHEVSYRISGTHSGNKDQIASTERLAKRLNGILAARSKMTVEEIEKQSARRDYVFDADEALENGLIDEII